MKNVQYIITVYSYLIDIFIIIYDNTYIILKFTINNFKDFDTCFFGTTNNLAR